MQPLCQFRFTPSTTHQQKTKKNAGCILHNYTDRKRKGMKFDAAVIRMRSDVCVHSWAENDGDYPDAWRAWARYGWRWTWKLTPLTGKSCLLWKIVICLDPWTFADVGKSEWIKAETVNWCNIQVWKSHVAYRDPDHTHTHIHTLA